MVLPFGPGCYTHASTEPVFTEEQMTVVHEFLACCKFARNSLGYSNRVLDGIFFRGVFIGSAPHDATAAFTASIDEMQKRVRLEFDDDRLELYSLEYTNQALAHKSSWHKDLADGCPYLNIFIALDDVNADNGMTTLRLDDGRIIDLSAPRNRWYSFDGSITHCAGKAKRPGSPRRMLIAVFRRSCDPEVSFAASSSYKAILTKRKRAESSPRQRSKVATGDAREPRVTRSAVGLQPI